MIEIFKLERRDLENGTDESMREGRASENVEVRRSDVKRPKDFEGFPVCGRDLERKSPEVFIGVINLY